MGNSNVKPTAEMESTNLLTIFLIDCDNSAYYSTLKSVKVFSGHTLKATVSYANNPSIELETLFVKRAAFHRAVAQFPISNTTNSFSISLEAHGRQFGTRAILIDNPNQVVRVNVSDGGAEPDTFIHLLYTTENLSRLNFIRNTRDGKVKSMFFEQNIADLDNGDVILYSGESAMSGLIKRKTYRPYSHCGVVVKTYPPRPRHNGAPQPTEKQLYIMESVGPKEGHDPFRKQDTFSGINMFPLQERLMEYHGQVWCLKQAQPFDEVQKETFLMGCWEMHGRRLPFDVIQGVVLLLENLRLWNIESNNAVFCSELVTYALSYANKLTPDEDRPSNVDPGEVSDFECFGNQHPRIVKYDV
eukprot:gene17459-20832_t